MYWKKGFFSSTYKLFEGEQQIGQLKEKAFSSTAVGSLGDVQLEFKNSGFFKVKANIVDSTQGEQVGEIKFNSWKSKADIKLQGKNYSWKYTNFWSSKWSLCKANGEPLIEYHSKKFKGEISADQRNDALILTGLYIHNYHLQISIVVLIVIVVVISGGN